MNSSELLVLEAHTHTHIHSYKQNMYTQERDFSRVNFNDPLAKGEKRSSWNKGEKKECKECTRKIKVSCDEKTKGYNECKLKKSKNFFFYKK